jgi:hypothetical protein
MESVGKPTFEHCPAILWSLGGEIRDESGGLVAKVGPEYGLCIIATKDIAEQGLVPVSVSGLGVVAFSPNDEDLASPRRTIDLDGEAIVVR